MSEVSTTEVPFVPKLPAAHASRLKAFARSIQRIAGRQAEPRERLRRLNELRADACDHGQALKLNDLKLMVAKNLLLDLATQGWRVTIRAGKISLLSQLATNPETAKDVIRNRHLQERDAQLREPSVLSFIHTMERRRLTEKGWQSIFSVMRDGNELADSVAKLRDNPVTFEASVSEVISPYIQFVESGARCSETGLLLSDIWRYFRHTWVTAYKSIPGRSLSILIRDKARPGHPVIGIAALGSAVVQQSIRDKWIGWDVHSVEKGAWHGVRRSRR